MEGMSEREYSAHSGISRGAIQKARKAGRLVVYSDGSINAAASDVRRTDMTDPDQQRRSTGGDAAFSGPADSSSYLKARTALTVYQAQERQLAIQKKKGTLVDRARAETLVFQHRKLSSRASAEPRQYRTARTPYLTLGADKGYDASQFVAALRHACVTPHIAQKSRSSAIDGRTTRHGGYALSIKHRKRIDLRRISSSPSAGLRLSVAWRRRLIVASNGSDPVPS
jgi:hypothetical protein